MEVILKEDVNKLGHRGDVVKIADGYGRNYLLPGKLAIEANPANKAVIEQMKGSAIRRLAKEKVIAEELSKKLESVELVFERKVARTTTSSARSHRATSRTSSGRRATPSTGARSRWTSRSGRWASSTCRSSCTARSPATSRSPSRAKSCRARPPRPLPAALERLNRRFTPTGADLPSRRSVPICPFTRSGAIRTSGSQPDRAARRGWPERCRRSRRRSRRWPERSVPPASPRGSCTASAGPA